MNIQHSSRTDQWFTPAPIITLVKKVLGNIDLDPASSELANVLVGAKNIIDVETNGLSVEWPEDCNIYINPPGGKTNGKSNTFLFWKKLMEYRNAGKLNHAIFMAFSAEAMQTTQGKKIQTMLDFSICIPAKRIAFVSPNGIKNSPSHSNCIIYIPGNINKTSDFIKHFSALGKCKE
jgi:hypothetical protein